MKQRKQKKVTFQQVVQGFIVDFVPVKNEDGVKFVPQARKKGNSAGLGDAVIAEACGMLFTAMTGRMSEDEAKRVWDKVMGAKSGVATEDEKKEKTSTKVLGKNTSDTLDMTDEETDEYTDITIWSPTKK